MFSNEFYPKKPQDFVCEKCDFSSSNKKDYNRHLQTIKHKNAFSQCFSIENDPKNPTAYKCNCGKSYKDNSGLWRHKQKCKLIECLNNKQEQSQKEELKLKIILIIEMLKHNNEFKGILQKQIQKIQYNQQEDLNNKEFILKKLDLLSDMLFENSEFINLLKNQLEIIEILIKNNKIKELL